MGSEMCIRDRQYIYWFGPSGHTNLLTLADKVNEQKLINMALKEQNRLLITEVEAFKNQTLEAVEARARRDLGMIAGSEVFYFVDVAKSENNVKQIE